ncbi:MAG: hypothetical protein ABI597_13165, partial [Gammaproteobacteria bacterium]
MSASRDLTAAESKEIINALKNPPHSIAVDLANLETTLTHANLKASMGALWEVESKRGVPAEKIAAKFAEAINGTLLETKNLPKTFINRALLNNELSALTADHKKYQTADKAIKALNTSIQKLTGNHNTLLALKNKTKDEKEVKAQIGKTITDAKREFDEAVPKVEVAIAALIVAAPLSTRPALQASFDAAKALATEKSNDLTAIEAVLQEAKKDAEATAAEANATAATTALDNDIKALVKAHELVILNKDKDSAGLTLATVDEKKVTDAKTAFTTVKNNRYATIDAYIAAVPAGPKRDALTATLKIQRDLVDARLSDITKVETVLTTAKEAKEQDDIEAQITKDIAAFKIAKTTPATLMTTITKITAAELKSVADLATDGITKLSLATAISDVKDFDVDTKTAPIFAKILTIKDLAKQNALRKNLEAETKPFIDFNNAVTAINATFDAADDAKIAPIDIIIRERPSIKDSLNALYSIEEKGVVTPLGDTIDTELKLTDKLYDGLLKIAAVNEFKTKGALATIITRSFELAMEAKGAIDLQAKLRGIPEIDRSLSDDPETKDIAVKLFAKIASIKLNTELSAQNAIGLLKSKAADIEKNKYPNHLLVADKLLKKLVIGDTEAEAKRINDAIRHLAKMTTLDARVKGADGKALYAAIEKLFDPALNKAAIETELKTLTHTKTADPLPAELVILRDDIAALNQEEPNLQARKNLKADLATFKTSLATIIAEKDKLQILAKQLDDLQMLLNPTNPRKAILSKKVKEIRDELNKLTTLNLITDLTQDINVKLPPLELTLDTTNTVQAQQILDCRKRLQQSSDIISTATSRNAKAQQIASAARPPEGYKVPSGSLKGFSTAQIQMEARKTTFCAKVLETYNTIYAMKNTIRAVNLLDDARKKVDDLVTSIKQARAARGPALKAGIDSDAWLANMLNELDLLGKEIDAIKASGTLTHIQIFSEGVGTTQDQAKFKKWKENLIAASGATSAMLLSGSSGSKPAKPDDLKPKLHPRESYTKEIFRCHPAETQSDGSLKTLNKGDQMSFYEHETTTKAGTPYYEIGVIDLPDKLSPRQLLTNFILENYSSFTVLPGGGKLDKDALKKLIVEKLPPGLNAENVANFLDSNLNLHSVRKNSTIAKKFMDYVDEKSTMTVDLRRDRAGDLYWTIPIKTPFFSSASNGVVMPSQDMLDQATKLLNTIIVNKQIPFHFDVVNSKQLSIALDCMIYKMGLEDAPGKDGVSLGDGLPRASKW